MYCSMTGSYLQSACMYRYPIYTTVPKTPLVTPYHIWSMVTGFIPTKHVGHMHCIVCQVVWLCHVYYMYCTCPKTCSKEAHIWLCHVYYMYCTVRRHVQKKLIELLKAQQQVLYCTTGGKTNKCSIASTVHTIICIHI